MAKRKTAAAPIRVASGERIMLGVDAVKPYERNAKIHSAEQVKRLRASLREFGFVRPLLVDEAHNLLAGHGTLAAAKAEGMEAVPCVVVTGLTEQQKRAYILADNKLAELAVWDEALLGLELEELDASGFALDLTGFTLDDLFGAEVADESGPPEPVSPKLSKQYTCPSCGYEMDAK